LRHFWHEIRWCFVVSSEFRTRCLVVGFSPWRLVDGTAGAAAAQEQQEQQQQPGAAAAQEQQEQQQQPPSFIAMVFPYPGLMFL